YHTFDDNKWYTVRVRVTPTKLEAWLDQEKIVDVATAGKKFSLRGDIEDSKPLGIASFQTTAAIKDIQLKKVGGSLLFNAASASPYGSRSASARRSSGCGVSPSSCAGACPRCGR